MRERDISMTLWSLREKMAIHTGKGCNVSMYGSRRKRPRMDICVYRELVCVY